LCNVPCELHRLLITAVLVRSTEVVLDHSEE
jgi:hypothetical protein